MGYEPSHENKINIHVGGVYGNKRKAMERFAQTFVLAPSQQAGSIAARDVPEALWRAGLLKDEVQLASLRPHEAHAAERLYFEDFLRIAQGGARGDAARGAQGAIQLSVRSLALEPRLLRRALCWRS